MDTVIYYLKKLSKLNKNGRYFCYRGQADEKWDLEEGIFREDSKNTSKYLNYIYQEVLQKIQLCGSYSPIDQLHKLQHYKLPTRLLDWTYNPLVALFFACGKRNKQPGKLYCFDISSIKEYSYQNICIKNNDQFIYRANQDRIEKYFHNELIINPHLNNIKNKYTIIEDIFLMNSKSKSIREINQASLLTINLSQDSEVWKKKMNINEIEIKDIDKKKIKEELMTSFNIWEYSIYPDNPDLATDIIKRKYQKQNSLML